MRSINWTSRRSQGYPLLAAGLRIPTRRKMSHEIILVLAKIKPVRVCIRPLYREYPPLKPKIEKPEKLVFIVLVRPFFPIVLKAFLPKVAVSRRRSPSNKMQDASQASTYTVRWGQRCRPAGLLPRTSQTALLLVSSVDVALENATEILGFGIGWESYMFFFWLVRLEKWSWFISFYEKRKNVFLVYKNIEAFLHPCTSSIF